MKNFKEELSELKMERDQHLMSIRVKGEHIGDIEIKDNKIVTSGQIGENTCENFVELIWILQGFNIEIDNFYF